MTARFATVASLVFALGLCGAREVRAQAFPSSRTSSGSNGINNTAGSSNPSSPFGGSTSAFGGSGMGSSNPFGGGGGGNTRGLGNQTDQQGSLLQGNTTSLVDRSSMSFVGTNTDGFVGAASSTSPTLGGTGQAGRGGMSSGMGGGMSGLGGMLSSMFGGMGGMGSSSGRGTTGQYSFQPRYAASFSFPRVAPARVQSMVAQTMTRFPGASPAEPIRVTMEGRVAILRGSVASDYDSSLAERLALLEPGVDSVRNELTVQTPAAPPEGE